MYIIGPNPDRPGNDSVALRSETAVFEMNEDAVIDTLRFLGRKFTRD